MERRRVEAADLGGRGGRAASSFFLFDGGGALKNIREGGGAVVEEGRGRARARSRANFFLLCWPRASGDRPRAPAGGRGEGGRPSKKKKAHAQFFYPGAARALLNPSPARAPHLSLSTPFKWPSPCAWAWAGPAWAGPSARSPPGRPPAGRADGASSSPQLPFSTPAGEVGVHALLISGASTTAHGRACQLGWKGALWPASRAPP